MSPYVLVESDGTIATLTLNRPERHNSLIPEVLTELLDILSDLREQPDLRAVVLQANGRSFSTGGDVRAFYNHLPDIQTYSVQVVGMLNQAILALIGLPVPVVAAVHGIVTGGSLGLVLASDIVLLSPDATLTPFYTTVGYSPDGGWTALLPFVIGMKRAATVQLLNESITPEQAVAWGVAQRIVPGERIREEAHAIALRIAQQKPGSVRRTKRLLWGNVDQIAERLQDERRSFVEHMDTPEAQDGMAAFLNNTI